MSFGSPLDIKEQVRQAVDIVELVERHVQLRRAGRRYVGLCPWHEDSRPSLQVNPERQTFKCWVCDIGGDVFSFVQRIEGVEFPEALRMLADRAGIDIPSPRAQAGGPGGPLFRKDLGKDGRRALLAAMAWAERQYHTFLREAPEAEVARNYLAQRHITPESIDRFHLGYCPNDGAWIIRKAQGQTRRLELLEAAGVLARSDRDGSFYDRFRGRILFPIRDTEDRPVGIGGRVLPESGLESRAKYVNSPETPLFSKHRLLYGLDVARAQMRKSNTALIMEGYTDCIVAHQYGFTDAVAVLGTALGESHIRLLRRFAERFVLVLDGDEAGRRRAAEVLRLFLAAGVDLNVLTLPEGNDPCDFLLQHGAEAFSDLLANRTVDAMEHLFLVHASGIHPDQDVHAADEAVERILGDLADVPTAGDAKARFRLEKMIQRLATWSRSSERDMRVRWETLKSRRQAKTRRVVANDSSGEAVPASSEDDEHQAACKAVPEGWEAALLEFLLRTPGKIEAVGKEIGADDLIHPGAQRLFATMVQLNERGVAPTAERLLLELEDFHEKNLVVSLTETAEGKTYEDPDEIAAQLVRGLLGRRAQRLGVADVARLREGMLDRDSSDDLLRQVVQRTRMRHGLAEPTEG